jgi:hypothetical protein
METNNKVEVKLGHILIHKSVDSQCPKEFNEYWNRKHGHFMWKHGHFIWKNTTTNLRHDKDIMTRSKEETDCVSQ